MKTRPRLDFSVFSVPSLLNAFAGFPAEAFTQ
jgi:hypothetical protein